MQHCLKYLKYLCNANACWLVLIYNALINVAKRLFKYVLIYFIIIFLLPFSSEYLDSTIKKSSKRQDSWGDITCQSPSSNTLSLTKDQGYVGLASGRSALSQWHDTIHLQKKGSKGDICGMLLWQSS